MDFCLVQTTLAVSTLPITLVMDLQSPGMLPLSKVRLYVLGYCKNTKPSNVFFPIGFRYLPFIALEPFDDIQPIYVARRDDGSSQPIYIPGGIPVGDEVMDVAYVSIT